MPFDEALSTSCVSAINLINYHYQAWSAICVCLASIMAAITSVEMAGWSWSLFWQFRWWWLWCLLEVATTMISIGATLVTQPLRYAIKMNLMMISRMTVMNQRKMSGSPWGFGWHSGCIESIARFGSDLEGLLRKAGVVGAWSWCCARLPREDRQIRLSMDWSSKGKSNLVMRRQN